MAEPSTVARPYAEAAFKLADEAGALAKWSEMLAALVPCAYAVSGNDMTMKHTRRNAPGIVAMPTGPDRSR